MNKTITELNEEKSTYRWIIIEDHIADLDMPPGGHLNAHGLSGPMDCDFSITDNPVDFRLYDADGELYYEGRLYGDWEGFEPLDDFGRRNAGAVTVKLLESDKWVEL